METSLTSKRARYDAKGRRCHLLLTFFLLEAELYRRVTEHHVERWFTDEEMNAALTESGFEVLRTCSGYTDAARSSHTARDTWVVHA